VYLVLYRSARIGVRRDTFYSPGDYGGGGGDGGDGGDRWKVSVGDEVIMSDPDANQRDDSFQNTNWFASVWHPFRVPWSVCQILAIYRDIPVHTTRDGTGTEPELRWFYEKSDISGVLSKSSSSANDNDLDHNEIFETDNVGEAPAEALLGSLALHHHHQFNPSDDPNRSLPPSFKQQEKRS